jgi:hypothetical protein
MPIGPSAYSISTIAFVDRVAKNKAPTLFYLCIKVLYKYVYHNPNILCLLRNLTLFGRI